MTSAQAKLNQLETSLDESSLLLARTSAALEVIDSLAAPLLSDPLDNLQRYPAVELGAQPASRAQAQ